MSDQRWDITRFAAVENDMAWDSREGFFLGGGFSFKILHRKRKNGAISVSYFKGPMLDPLSDGFHPRLAHSHN